MLTVKEAIVRVVAIKLREYYLRGVRDARIEHDEDVMPSFLEEFDPGDFDKAHDQNVWLRIADDILDM